MPRYFIEQAPDRFYQASELASAKARARTLSKRIDGVYVIEETFDPELCDYVQTGSIAYFGGYQDAREGTLAR
jgi:hypothetical protein